MRVLVTGGCGFIGSHLVELLLEKDYEVNIIDIWKNRQFLRNIRHKGFDGNFFHNTILNDGALTRAMEGCGAVVHLAGILGTREAMFNYRPYKVAEVNVVGTAKVLHYARQSEPPLKVLFASTPDVPWLNPYKVTKNACEGFVDIYRRYFDLEVVMFRFRNVYGPRERWLEMTTNAPYVYQKASPTFIYRALRNEPLTIYGTGRQSADYVYVWDVAGCVEAGIRSPEACVPHHIPVGTGKMTSVNKLANLIIRLTKSTSEKKHVPMREGETPVKISTDMSVMQKYLGIDAEKFTKLKDGLETTIRWLSGQIG